MFMILRLKNYFHQFSRNARLFLLATIISGIAYSGLQLFFNIYLRSRNFDLDFIGLINATLGSATGIQAFAGPRDDPFGGIHRAHAPLLT